MALKGSFYGTTSNSYIKPKIEWSAVQSVAGNYSDITATLTYSRTNQGYSTGGAWSGSLTIGQDTKTGTGSFDITYNSNTVAITHTARVHHDEYGKLSVTISATGAISGSSLSSTNISEKVTLDTIARASAISASDADIESRSTVVISQKNSAFTHSVAFSFGDLKGYVNAEGHVVDAEVKLSNTTINFLLPESFYNQIPDEPSGTCHLECRTYSGSTQIGQTQKSSFTARANAGKCAPLVEGSVVDVNEKTLALTGNNPKKLVRYASTARCSIAVQSRKGALIATVHVAEKQIEVADAAEHLESYTDIEEFGLDKVLFKAVDSRGYPATVEGDYEIVPYAILTNNAHVHRTDPTSGNAILTLEGDCFYGNFGAVDNTLSVEYQIGDQEPVTLPVEIGENGKYTLKINLSGLDYTRSHSIKVIMQDAVTTAPKNLTVQKGIPVFDWGEEDFRFNVPVDLPGLTIGGKSLEDIIRQIVQGG